MSVIADSLGVDFPGLLRKFWQLFPEQVDDYMTVPAQWGPILEKLQHR